MRKSRVIDYAIYISSGLALCALLFVPILCGVDMRPILPRIAVIGSAVFVAGYIGYDLRDWRARASFWVFISSVLVLHLVGAYLAYNKGLSINTITWVLISSAEIYWSEKLFRYLVGVPANS